MPQVNVRNLEQIQEHDSARPSRIGTLLLVSLAGAAVVSGFVMMSKKSGAPTRSTQDPLAALVAESKASGTPAEALDGKDVSFPRILSDGASPTTALAAVKDERGRLVKQDGTANPGDATPVLRPPRIWGGGASPTTALARVKDERARLVKQDGPANPGDPTAVLGAPPPASD